MPTVPVSILNLLGGANTGQSGNAPDRVKESFQALLNIGNDNHSDIADRDNDHPSLSHDSQRERTVDPVAAPVEVPTAFFAVQKNQERETIERVITTRRDAKADAREDEQENAATAAALSKEDTQPQKQSAPKTSADKADKSDAPATASQVDTKTQAATAPKATSAKDAAPAQDAASDDTKNQLQQLSQSLLELLQALTGIVTPAAATVAQTPAATSTDTANVAADVATAAVASTATAPQSLSDLLLAAAAITTKDIAPAQAAIITTSASAQTPVSLETQAANLLQDIQSILQQLKAALPAANGTAETKTTAAIVAASEKNTPALLDTLKADIKALQQLLPQLAAPAANAHASGATTGKPAMKTESDLLKNLVGNALDLVKSILPKPAAPQAATAALKPDSATFDVFKDMLAHKPATAENVAARAALPAAENSMVPPAPVQNTIVKTTNDTAITIAPLVAAAPSASMDSNTDSSGSNNQNGAMAQPLVATSVSARAAANGDTSTSFSRTLEQMARPVLDQVTFQVKTALGDGSSKIHIQLSPDDLGKLDIKLNVGADGKTGVVITADNKNTLDMLQRDTAGLQRALADAGLKTDGGSLDFNLRGGQQEQSRGNNSQAAMTYQKAAPEEEVIPPTATTRSYVVNLTEGLDIRI